MPEKEVLKMKSFVTNKGDKLIKTDKFKIKKILKKIKKEYLKCSLIKLFLNIERVCLDQLQAIYKLNPLVCYFFIK
jgi:ribosome biogenesis SPOUT family RNA methylase Rps3